MNTGLLQVSVKEAGRMMGFELWAMLNKGPVRIIRRPGRRPRVRVSDINLYVFGKKNPTVRTKGRSKS